MKQPLSLSMQGISPSLALEVAGKSPLLTGVRVKNNSANLNLNKYIGYLLGTYDVSTGVFNCISIVVNGVTYVVGCFGRATISGPGGEDTWGLYTYAPNVSQAMTLSANCWVCNSSYPMGELRVDYGEVYPDGNWVIGIEWSKFKTIVDGGHLDAVELFPDILTVKPAV